MSVTSFAPDVWQAVVRVLFGKRPSQAMTLQATPRSQPVPPPPLIERPQAAPADPLSTVAASAKVAAAAPAARADMQPTSDRSATAGADFMLSARLASASSLNPPKHRTGKSMPRAAAAGKRRPAGKSIPKKAATKPKASPRARHVWLHGAAAAAPSRGAEIVQLQIVTPAPPASAGRLVAPAAGHLKAKRAA